MEPLFNADFYMGNRANLRRKIGLAKNELAIVPAHSKLQKSHDEAYKFVQDNNFYYLTGINEPDCLLILTSDHDVLLSPAIDPHHQLWEGQAGLQQLSAVSGISDVHAGKTGQQQLKELVTQARKIYLPLPYDSHILRRYYRMVANPARRHWQRKLKALNSGLVIDDLRPALAQLRMVKQPAELAAISQAIDITVASIEVVEQSLPALGTENEVQAMLEYEFWRRGADGPGFDSIVASGPNTTQIHYSRTGQTPLDKSLVLLDVGAQVAGYKSDISRVVSQNGFNSRQKQLYQAVQELQNYAFSLLKPGLSLSDYEDQVDQKSNELTAALRVSRHKTSKRGLRVIPHAVSHHLGLDTHDAADYKAPLQPDMVLAVEPGIYLPEEGIGMRIEDDVLITDSGIKVLGKMASTKRRHDGKIEK